MKKGLSGLKIRLYRKGASVKPSAPRLPAAGEEALPGVVQGKKASAPEVVLARVLDKYRVNYTFRYRVPVVKGQMGLRGEKEVDFVISGGTIRPVQVDNVEFIHASAQQKQEDYESDLVVNAFFKEYGAVPVVRINAFYLQTPDMADMKAKELGII